MAHYCVVCKEIFTKEDHVAVYNFPRDPKLRKAWQERIGRENLPNYAEICSKHFTPDCFYRNPFGGGLKPTALPTIIDNPPTKETQNEAESCDNQIKEKPELSTRNPNTVYLGPSEFSRNWIHCVAPAANAGTYVAQDQDKTKEKVALLHKEKKSLQRKIALNTKCLKEIKKLRLSRKDSSASGRKRLLPNPEEGCFIKTGPKTSKPSATATQLGSGTPNTLVENIKIKEDPEEEVVILLETSKPSATATKFGRGTTTLVDNVKKKEDPEEEDITIELESVLEVENAKIKTEPLSDYEQEPPYLTQEYRSAIIRKCPGAFNDAILGFPQESRCGVAKKCSDPSDDAILGFPQESRCGVAQKCSDPSDAIIGFPQESRCGVAQKCFDPSDDVILGFRQESRCGVAQKCFDPSDDAILGFPQESRCSVGQKCSDPSDDAIIGFPQESRCGVGQKCTDPSDDAINVVQKCSYPSDDAILGVPVEYLPLSCQNVSEKLEHNQSSASGSATSNHIPFMHYNDAIIGFPQESRCGIAQKCFDPSDDAILGFPRESRCGVGQKCTDPSDDAINVVQKCSDPSDDAILGVPIEYLPISCQDVSEKLEHNQSSASGSATSDHIPFMYHNDQATTSQNAPTLIPMELAPSPITIPISENLSAENSVSENLSDENSMTKSLSGENSMTKSLFDENSMSENLSDENSMSKCMSDENTMSENLSDKNSVSNNREKDEFDLFGEFVANKLRSMRRHQAIQIQSKFGDLLFKLESGELNIQSAKIWLNNVQFQ